MKRTAAAALAAVLLVATPAARADELRATPALAGIWIATKSDGQVFRGTWAAEVAIATPNVALGTWSLMDERGTALLGGTWSARKAPRGWRGAWSARVAVTNQIFSGTWEADDRGLKGAKTFRDLLARTAETQIAGVWHLGRTHGNWWLKSKSL
jgi:hypothetical protein